MTFSFVFPARGHKDKLYRNFNSIVKTTDKLANIEILVGVDNDDEELKDIRFDEGIGKQIKVFEYPHRENNLQAYHNALAKKANGDVIWVWSQECVINTPHWDTIATRLIKKHRRWAVWLGMPRDVVPIFKDGKPILRKDGSYDTKIQVNPITNDEFSCYPMISRHAYQALGFVLKPDLRMWGSDLYMCMLFNNPKIAHRIDMHEIQILSEDPISTMKAGGANKMDIYQEDLKAMEAKGLCEIHEDGTVAYDVTNDMTNLRHAMAIPRMHRL